MAQFLHRRYASGMTYIYLAIAIVAEVCGTTLMRLTEGFTRPLPSLGVVIGYAISFYFLSLTLKTLPVGIAYAIWSGAGIILIAAAGWIFLGQKLDSPALAGMALIIAGIVVMNTLSRTGGPG